MITFDLRRKTFEYHPVFTDHLEEYRVQLEIEGLKLETIVKVNLQKVNTLLSPDMWLTDFYVMPGSM